MFVTFNTDICNTYLQLWDVRAERSPAPALALLWVILSEGMTGRDRGTKKKKGEETVDILIKAPTFICRFRMSGLYFPLDICG